jgi:hypothetical protein
MVPVHYRFRDLKARGIVENWTQLRKMIEKENFPPGKLLSPSVRAWTDDEIAGWLETRPTAPSQPLRGGAKIRAELKAAKAEAATA